MGWYFMAQDYFDAMPQYKQTCPICQEKLKVGDRVIFIDFGRQDVVHALCYWREQER